MQFLPSSVLQPYIKNYTVITVNKALDDETFYPSGYIDLVVNLSEIGTAATTINGQKKDTPSMELLGHITTAAKLTATVGARVLIARIYPHAASLFFSNPISDFTNLAVNLADVSQKEINKLYHSLSQETTIRQKITKLENYFIGMLKQNESQIDKIDEIKYLCSYPFATDESFNMNSLMHDTGKSDRYIQKLFYNKVGTSPLTLFAVKRFNKSLRFVLNSGLSLTSIAYECNYYDQAHFIKEFRRFSGITPTEARQTLTINGEAFQQAVNVGF